MSGSSIGNRPTAQSQPVKAGPMSRAMLNLLAQLRDAGGRATIDIHGRLIAENGGQFLSGQPQDWLRIMAYGMIKGEGDGRTVTFTEQGQRAAGAHPRDVILTP